MVAVAAATGLRKCCGWMRGRRRPSPASLPSVLKRDQRGIALQTVIIMVALIAIAVTISTVILTRGGEVADDLERQNVTFNPDRFKTEALCMEYDYKWDKTDSANPVCKEKP